MEYAFLLLSMLAGTLTNALGPLRRGARRGVVVFKLDHIGDLVTAVPALEAVRARHASDEITLVVGSWCADLARALLPVDRVVVYDSRSFSRDGTKAGAAELRRALGRARFRTAYALRDDVPAMLYCLGGGAARRRDRGTVRVGHRFVRSLARLAGRGDIGPLHEVETNLRVAGERPSGPPPAPRLSVPGPARAAVAALVAELRGAEGRPLVVVHPGAAWEHRRWPAPRFAELVVRLVGDLGASVAVTGSGEERALAGSVACPGPLCRVTAGDLGIVETAALLAAADCYVGADTGIMHLAVAVGTPVVGLFGPQDPRRFGPLGPADVVLRHPVPCAPCRQIVCPHDGLCMASIGIDEVAAAVSDVVGSGREEETRV